MKSILFITAFNPSKDDAGSNYTRQLLSELGKKFKISIIVFKRPEQKVYVPPFDSIKIIDAFNVTNYSRFLGLLSIPFLFPFFTARFSWLILSKLRHYINEDNYDFIYFDFSQTFIYALFLKHSHKLLMAHDVIYQRYKRKNEILAWWVRLCEGKLLAKANKIFTFSEKDCLLLKKIYGLESEYTSFFLQKEVIDTIPNKESGNYFVFFGNWNRQDNYESLQWFLDNVYEKIDKEIKFKIIGLKLPEIYKNRIRELVNIEYLGFVDNPYQIIGGAKALISPLHSGAGVKVKVIEALACGTPVIGTDIAFEGIDSKYGDFMIYANSPIEFVTKINMINLNIDARIKFKKMFVANYVEKPILKYLYNNS